MPWKTDRQRRWGNSPTGKKELGPKAVKEFNEATKGMKLPEKAPGAPENPAPKKTWKVQE